MMIKRNNKKNIINKLLILSLISVSIISTIIKPNVSKAQNINISVLKLNPQNNGLNISYLNKQQSFEKIFYNNLQKEIINNILKAEKEGKVELFTSKNIKFQSISTNLTHKRILEAIDLGLTQISVVPLDSYYDNFEHKNLGYIEYPFIFNDINHVYNKYFLLSKFTASEINLQNQDSIAVGLIPYSFKIFASKSDDLSPFSIKTENITFEKNAASNLYFRYFKTPDTINGVAKIDIKNEKNKIIETNLIDYYDNKLYSAYPNIYLTNHSLKSSVITLNKNWWKTLNYQEREIITSAISSTIISTTKETTLLNNSIIKTFSANNNFKVINVSYVTEFAELRRFLSQIYIIKNNKLNNYLQNR